MSALRMTLALSLLGLSSVAAAAGWGDLGESFPVFPCNDGWAACLVDGQKVDPGMVKDSAGRPMPADLRVGFFDLQPTRSLSPFVSLSAYTGELPAAPEPAAAEPAVAEAPPEQAGGGDTGSAEAQPAATNTNTNNGGGSVSGGSAGTRSTGGSEAPANDGGSEAAVGGGSAGTRSTGGSDAAEEPASGGSVRPSSVGTREETTSTEGGGAVRPSSARTADEGASTQPAVESAIQVTSSPPPAAVADDSCDNLVRLEPMAMMGKLSDGQISCLDTAVKGDAKQTDRNKTSRLLMANYWAKGDKSAWEKQVKFHLDEIDKSDPDLSYKYSQHLARKGSANGAIKWADVALERRSVWTGNTYVSRVFNLYKIKAAAAQSLWQRAENAHASTPSDQTKADTEKYRNQTKVFAREWYDYAKEAGKDPSNAMSLCMAAAGTREYCEGG